jgi:hypothetical protein
MPGCSYSCWCDNSSMPDWDLETPPRSGDAPTVAEAPPSPDRRRRSLSLRPDWVAAAVLILLGPFVLTINEADKAVELRGVKITAR